MDSTDQNWGQERHQMDRSQELGYKKQGLKASYYIYPAGFHPLPISQQSLQFKERICRIAEEGSKADIAGEGRAKHSNGWLHTGWGQRVSEFCVSELYR